MKFPGNPNSMKHQQGATLMETMIGLALSVFVTTSMVLLMGNSMGSATRIIQMSQLADELRNTMSMMSRDVRRANFNPNSAYCYSNPDCATDGSATQAALITIPRATGESCFVFGLDRDWDGNANNDGGGAFRRRQVNNNDGVLVGQVEVWIGNAISDCDENINSTAQETNDDWIPVTDPNLVDITELLIARPFTDGSVTGEGGVVTTIRSRQVQLQIEGELVIDRGISRRIEDTVKVRNDFYL